MQRLSRASVQCVDEALKSEGRVASMAIDWEGQWAEVALGLGLQVQSKEEAEEAVLQILRDCKGSGDVQAAVDAGS